MNETKAILDNPIWSALLSDNYAFGSGTDEVKLFDPEIAPFAGLNADTPENFRTLFNLTEASRTVVLFSPKPDLLTFPFEAVDKVPGYQMVFEAEPPVDGLEDDLDHLSENDVPAMLALTQLAKPGPFASRTVSFGGYRGIFDDGQLVAMGGQRLKAKGYTEISAICTHPDYSGKGYGRSIMHAVIRDIISAGNTAYLHVRADNNRAIALYQRLGFVIRSEMNFYVLNKTALFV